MEKRIKELDKILNKLYEDRALERISEERYHSMSAGYEAEHKSLIKQRHTLEEAILKAEEVYCNVQSFMDLIRLYTAIQELNTKILNELIDRIIVYEKVTNPDGQKSQRVDIHYKFIGYMPIPIDTLLVQPALDMTIISMPPE